MRHSITNAKTTIGKMHQATKLMAAAAWIMLWQLLYVLLDKPLLLPSPWQVVHTLFGMCQRAIFWTSVGASLGKVLLAFGLAVAVGCILAALASIFPAVRTFLHPPIAIIRATPVASFTMLVLVWVSSKWLPVLVAFLMVLPIVYENVYQGILSSDPLLLEMGQVYGFSPWKKLRFLYFPAILPFFHAACTSGMGYAWKSSIAAEVLGLPKLAIGKQIHDSKIYLEIPELFAWTAVILLLSMTLEKLLHVLMKQMEKRILLAQEVEE